MTAQGSQIEASANFRRYAAGSGAGVVLGEGVVDGTQGVEHLKLSHVSENDIDQRQRPDAFGQWTTLPWT